MIRMELLSLLCILGVQVIGIQSYYAKPYSPVYGKHWCPKVCDKTCKYGRVRDFHGCFLCKCRRAQRGLCRLPKKVGPCEAAVSRFFFNTKSGQCEPFTWGGCQPNKNNFNTNSACVNTCGQPGICGLDLKVGPCKAAIPRYYFNAKSGKCEFFSWGGCQPNGNNFKTKQDCVDACAICHKRICRRKYACPLGFKRNKRGCPTCKCVRKPSENSGCNVKRDVGDCGKKEKRYFYNQLTGNCQKFIWKGCKPTTSNNFKTIQECKGACVCGPVCAIFCQYGNVPDERGCATCKCRPGPCKLITCLNSLCAPEDRATDKFGCPFCKCRRCFEPKKIGPCRAKISRYFYNKTTGKCEQFYWGGCQANGNNFKTLWHCKRFCEI